MEDEIDIDFLDYLPEELDYPVPTFAVEEGEVIAEEDMELMPSTRHERDSFLSEEDDPLPRREQEIVIMNDALPPREEEEVLPEGDKEPFNFDSVNIAELTDNVSEKDMGGKEEWW